MPSNDGTVDNLVNALSVPGRVLGESVNALADGIRPEHNTFEEVEVFDGTTVTVLVVVFAGFIGLILYLWSK